MLLVIENGELYDPVPRGVRSLLIVNDKIEKVGAIDRRALDALGVEYEVIDATDGWVKSMTQRSRRTGTQRAAEASGCAARAPRPATSRGSEKRGERPLGMPPSR